MNNCKTAKISFIGDISLNNNYVGLYKRGTNPFKDIGEVLNKSDFVIGNLECLAAGKDGENELKVPRLKTNAETLNFLTNINLGLASLAHNHIYDNLESGYNNTIDSLINNKIGFLGAGRSPLEAAKPVFKEINNIKFCFFNYVSPDTNPKLPESALITPNFFNLQTAIKELKVVRNRVDHIVILLHWGGLTEKGYYPDLNQPKTAHELLDAGADLIVGHHSHTVQPFEKYKGKYIFYSIGNFCFDDIEHEGRTFFKLNRRQKKSITVTVDFSKTDYRVSLIPFYNKNLFIELKQQLIFNYRIRNFIFPILKKFPSLWKLYFFQMKKINVLIHYLFVKEGSLWTKISSLKIKGLARFVAKRHTN